jgi:STE24 endopeptidase
LPAAVFAAAWVVGALLLWPTEVPDGLRLTDPDPRGLFTAAELEEARDYERFVRINTLLSLVVLVIVLVLYAARGERFTRESAAGRIGTGMLLAMLGFAFVWLAQLPFGLAGLWWDRRHDISEVGYVDWALSSFFGLGGVFVFVCVAVLVVMALAAPLRDRWWIAGAPVFVALGLLFAFVSPFLLPDLRSLRDDRLEAEARRIARVQDVSSIPVKVEDVDEFTEAPNAEAAGLGPTRRVILWNTLLQKPFSRKEVRFVIAHELAHHSRDHIWKGFGWYALFAVPSAFVVAAVTRRRGGMYEPRAVPLALVVVVLLQIGVTPLQNVVSRRMEAEADWVALETTRDPGSARRAFTQLAEKSLTDPKPPTWSYVLLEGHPTMTERIAMADAWRRRRALSRTGLGPTR